jgi:phage antirepressor YoqD-like protein
MPEEMNGQEQEQETQEQSLTFDGWLGEQPDEIKTLLEGHTKGLKSALESERETRKTLEKQVRDLAAKAEKDSDAQKELAGIADQLGEADRKTDFYEAAHAAGVTNLKLAYVVATTDGMFDRRGQVNFETLKQSYPELFGVKQTVKGNAGTGTNTEPPTSGDMNAFIRRAAGRM